MDGFWWNVSVDQEIKSRRQYSAPLGGGLLLYMSVPNPLPLIPYWYKYTTFSPFPLFPSSCPTQMTSCIPTVHSPQMTIQGLALPSPLESSGHVPSHHMSERNHTLALGWLARISIIHLDPVPTSCLRLVVRQSPTKCRRRFVVCSVIFGMYP